MKRIALPIILATGLLAQIASAQFSSTPAIGYYTTDILLGQSTWVSGFVAKKDFQGAATSMVGGVTSDINVSGTPFTPGAFTLHYVEILSGPNTGLMFDITGNTNSQITVDGDTSAAGLTGTETFCVRRHATLGTLFAGGAGIEAFLDLLNLQNSDGTQTNAYFDTAGFIDADSGLPADDVIVYPGQGITFIVADNRVVTWGGNSISYVKTGPTLVPVYTTGVNFIGVINPLVNTTAPAAIDSTTVAAYSLNSMDPFLDLAATYTRDGNFTGITSYYTDGTDVVDTGTGSPANGDTVFNGTAIEVVPSTDRLMKLEQTFTYTP